MPTLIERLDAQIASLVADKARIDAQYVADLDALAVKLTQLRRARTVITPDVEQAYAALRALKLIQEI